MILATVVQSIWNAFQEVVNSILTIDNIFYVGIGFLLLMILFTFIKSSFSYECKLERSVNRLNNWLFKHQTINEQNLVEFNNLIKDRRSPKILRKHWQQYMLYRDKLPSEYISSYNCIDKPAKTSSFSANIKNFISIYRVTALITFFLSLISFSGRSDALLYYLSMTLVTPAIILLLGTIFTLILRSVQNYNLASLYQTFHIFNRYIDKASATIPKYVDFEILFTKREIRDGIPILGEYLEKRARQEQEELEEAQRNAVAHEEYDFAESGVDGSLMLERAMKESETFLNAKQRIYAEIQQFESEISTLKKNYENTSKDYQRKLQASKENMERLRQQQEESTNRIEVNYIRKQQQDEVKKQEQLEKDQEDATNKFNTEINTLTEEIEKRKADLEAKKLRVQEAMESEYQTFASKLHKNISNDVEKVSESNIQKINSEKEQYAQAITYLKGEVDSKDEIIKAKDQTISELNARIEALLAQDPDAITHTQDVTQTENTVESLVEESTQETTTEDGHYDNNGYYWFNDGTYYDNQGLYHDAIGNVYDSEGNLQATNMPVETEIKENQTTTEITETIETPAVEHVEENVAEQSEDKIVEEQPVEEQPTDQVQEEIATESAPVENSEQNIISEEIEQPVQEVTQEESETPAQEETLENIGYDSYGNYKYKNGSFYDTENLYHDIDGKVYDTEGKFIREEEVEQKEPSEEPVNPVQEEQPTEEVKMEEKPEAIVTESNESQQEDKAKDNSAEETKEQNIVQNESEVEEISKKDTSTEDESKKTEEKPKRKAGRPRKEKTEEELNKPKRSVGRPRKEKTEEELNKPKRSVGRPRKEKTEEELNKPKRRVGRPRKSETLDNEAQSTEILKHLGQSLIDLSEQKAKKRKATKKTEA